jgi:hypothetical protein
MADLSTLVLTAADYTVVFSFPNSSGLTARYVLQTASELTYDDSVEGEYSYAIGSEEPFANKTNARSYKGGWAVQSGEWNAILQLGGFQSGMQIKGATLSIAAAVGAFAKTYKNMNILKDSGSIQAKAKETMNKLDWQAIGLG